MNRPIRRALISVFDKDGILDFAKGLAGAGVEILSSGGTARLLGENGVAVTKVSDYTGSPEMLDGRVKTLHPKIHGGILALRDVDGHLADLERNDIGTIDLVVVNLYPFERTARSEGASPADVIEMIDIGGPTMVRAAAKNHAHVGIVGDPQDYKRVLKQVASESALTDTLRRELAVKAFRHTADYDAAVHAWLSRLDNDDAPAEGDLPGRLSVDFVKVQDLRYGENPHQQAAFYRDQQPAAGSLAAANQHQGKALSFNNIADSDAALQCVRQFNEPACVIVKHANPCGVAVDNSILGAYQRAFSTDPTSAFGGIIAFNRRLDAETARAIIDKQFVEVIVAPEIDQQALEALAGKTNVRVLETGQPADANELDIRKVSGGMLVQSADDGMIDESDLKVVSDKKPTPEQIADMMFAWRVAKFVKSNAIVFCKDGMTIGVGAGQMSRVYSTKIAAIKAGDENLEVAGSVMASDAFFPFRDGIDAAAETGIAAIIQPGGSMRDDEVIAAANEHGLAMVFTGMRHFRH